MNNIAILTYHSIIDQHDDRPWAFLSTSVKVFENTLKYLKKKGYTSISLNELYELKQNRKDDDRKRVIINFDDGFLDNYTIAYPLLKKYGFKATVYVSTEFVDPRSIVRKLAYDDIVQGKLVKLEDNWGYMSWNELRIIDQSGVIDVQAHAMSHTWYYISDTLMDIHHEKDKYFWLWWNKYPDRKPFWLTEYQEKEVPYGYPIFEYAKSLSGKVFIPKKEIIQFCIDFYGKNHELYRTDRKRFLEALGSEIHQNVSSSIGEYESDQTFFSRIEAELVESKAVIEEKLNKKISFLAWPGGAVCDSANIAARRAGYLAVTSKEKHYNEVLTDPIDKLYRMGAWSGIKWRGRPITSFEKVFIAMQLNRTKGNKSLINKILNQLGNLHRKRHIDKNRKQGEDWK